MIDGWHGLAVLATRSRLASSPALAAELDRLRSPEFLRVWLSSIELARIAAEVRAGAAREAEARAVRRASGLEQRLLDEPPEDGGDSTLAGT